MSEPQKPAGYGHDHKGTVTDGAVGGGKPGVAHTVAADKSAGEGKAPTAKTYFIDGHEIDIRKARPSSAPRAGSTSSCRICATRRSPATGRTATAASAWSRSRASACSPRSCLRTPTPGMKVKTDTDRAKTARKMVTELLLTDQPAIEVAHDPDSELWQIVKRGKLEAGRFPKRDAIEVPPPDRSHVAMAVNLDACIQCNLCVRACREVQVNDVIGMAGRGHLEKIVFDIDDPMGASTCVACGECVQACPTGALMPSTMVDDNNVYLGKPDRTVD